MRVSPDPEADVMRNISFNGMPTQRSQLSRSDSDDDMLNKPERREEDPRKKGNKKTTIITIIIILFLLSGVALALGLINYLAQTATSKTSNTTVAAQSSFMAATGTSIANLTAAGNVTKATFVQLGSSSQVSLTAFCDVTSTNNTVCFRNWYAALIASTLSGYIKSGNWMIPDPIVLTLPTDRPVYIYGDGPTTILNFTNPASITALLFTSGGNQTNGFILRDMSITGSASVAVLALGYVPSSTCVGSAVCTPDNLKNVQLDRMSISNTGSSSSYGDTLSVNGINGGNFNINLRGVVGTFSNALDIIAATDLYVTGQIGSVDYGVCVGGLSASGIVFDTLTISATYNGYFLASAKSITVNGGSVTTTDATSFPVYVAGGATMKFIDSVLTNSNNANNAFYGYPALASYKGVVLPQYNNAIPVMANSTVAVTNNSPVPATVFIPGQPASGISDILLSVSSMCQLIDTSMMAGQYTLYPGDSIAVVYSGVTPTWSWAYIY